MTYKTLANKVMQNFPEYAQCLQCTKWDYETGIYGFYDEEEKKYYTVTIDMVEKALPILKDKIDHGKLFFKGLVWWDTGTWDCWPTDAVVQIAIFGDVIYG